MTLFLINLFFSFLVSSWIKEIIIIKVILLLFEFDLVIRVELIIGLIKVFTKIDATLRYADITFILIGAIIVRGLLQYGRLTTKVILIVY